MTSRFPVQLFLFILRANHTTRAAIIIDVLLIQNDENTSLQQVSVCSVWSINRRIDAHIKPLGVSGVAGNIPSKCSTRVSFV